MYKTKNSRFFAEFDKPQKKKMFYGGSGSGKSLSIAQRFIIGLCSGDGKRRLILRKYFPSLKTTTYQVLKDIISDWGLENQISEHTTDHYFKCGNNYLYYMGLEDVERFKGGEFAQIWLEETTEFREDDYKQLSLRLGRDKRSEGVEMYMSFNPIDQNHWCVNLLNQAIENPETFLVHHSTYNDNKKNLSRSFMKELEDLIKVDENYYRVYTLGQPGVLKNRIYSHFQIENSVTWPWEQLNQSAHAYGLDYGFNHPMSLCEGWVYENELYVKELYYEREKTTDDLALWMYKNGVSKTAHIYADSAEPDRIVSLNTPRTIKNSFGTEESYRFNVLPAKKDVKAGIDYIKARKVHLCASSTNAIKEYNNYKYKQDSNGNAIEEPVKAFDDFLDSARYLFFSMNINYNIKNMKGMSKGFSFKPHLQEVVFRGM